MSLTGHLITPKKKKLYRFDTGFFLFYLNINLKIMKLIDTTQYEEPMHVQVSDTYNPCA